MLNSLLSRHRRDSMPLLAKFWAEMTSLHSGRCRAPIPTALTDANAELLTQSEQWVVPQGGEYFFSPSLSAVANTFALAA